MILYVPTNVFILGAPVQHQLPLEFAYNDKSKTLVVNGYQFTPEESSGIIGYFKGLEDNK